MRKLNEKEAVHCETLEQFNEINKILGIQFGKKLDASNWSIYGEKTCLSYFLGYGFDEVSWHKQNGFKILSYAEFMVEEWKPEDGDDVWLITVKDDCVSINFHIQKTKYFNSWKWLDDCYAEGSMFRTRQLARDAKKEIQDVLKKARKG